MSRKRDLLSLLSRDELAFYDALGTNESAVQVMGDATLTLIAREMTDIIRRNVTIDWTQKCCRGRRTA